MRLTLSDYCLITFGKNDYFNTMSKVHIKNIKSILWLAPNFNHYKARFLNHLAEDPNIALTILSGTGRQNMGDEELDEHWEFKLDKVEVSKQEFGNSSKVRLYLKQHFMNYDWVLIPTEKKNLLLFVYALYLRIKFPKTKLVSYNHPILKSGSGKIMTLDKLFTKFYYRFFNRIIFYTETSCEWAIEQKLISPQKAFWANNTIDTDEVAKQYVYELPPKNLKTILFIGRLIPSKRIDTLIKYYKTLKKVMPDTHLKLEIIGDGPDKSILEDVIKLDSSIKWHGSIVDENKIAPIMKKASIVFIPGLSGLSINHAFAYGRPYFTLEAEKHGPEINYLKDGENGYILKGSFNQNIEIIESVLFNESKLNALCLDAKVTGENLSIKKWVKQMKLSLTHE